MKKSYILVFLLIGCAGNLQVEVASPQQGQIESIHILNSSTSLKVPKGFFILPLSPFIGVTMWDKEAELSPGIGNTHIHIEKYIESKGIQVTHGSKENVSSNTSLFLVYQDLWKWDLKYYLFVLKIYLIDPVSGEVIAEGTYESAGGEFHDFASSEREVPKMLDAIFAKL